ncbi:MAG: PQQ-binding-like beta-propeller repeat protein, partial [Planctomycetota bacterium]
MSKNRLPTISISPLQSDRSFFSSSGMIERFGRQGMPSLKGMFPAILLIVFVASPAPGESQPWPHFGGPKAGHSIEKPLPSMGIKPEKRWEYPIGFGMSGIVTDGLLAVTQYLEPWDENEAAKPESERSHREMTVALNAQTGERIWQHVHQAKFLESQQAFGGRVRSPQATPLLTDNHVVTIGFEGQVTCHDRSSGRVIWTRNLVHDDDAIAVQFGFSASPTLYKDSVIILAGGPLGVCRIGLVEGEVIWKFPIKEASYAKPQLFSIDGRDHVVAVTRNRILGINAENGKGLWESKLQYLGNTNVPTPVLCQDRRIIVSGQGVGGTAALDINTDDDGCKVEEAWFSDCQWFYCNAAISNGVYVGCVGDSWRGLDIGTGETVIKTRSFGDATLIAMDGGLLVLSGEGELATIKRDGKKLKTEHQWQVL